MGTAGAKVTVASKLPFKLELQCSSARVVQQRHQGQQWKETEYFKNGPMQVINGTAYPNGQLPNNMPPPPPSAVGYALTPGVSKDLFDAWLLENAGSAMVRNRLIFAYEKTDSVKDAAKDCKDVDSGLGPLTPDSGDRENAAEDGRRFAGAHGATVRTGLRPI